MAHRFVRARIHGVRGYAASIATRCLGQHALHCNRAEDAQAHNSSEQLRTSRQLKKCLQKQAMAPTPMRDPCNPSRQLAETKLW